MSFEVQLLLLPSVKNISYVVGRWPRATYKITQLLLSRLLEPSLSSHASHFGNHDDANTVIVGVQIEPIDIAD